MPMAVSSTPATAYVSPRDFTYVVPKNCTPNSKSVSFAKKLRQYSIRSSSEVSETNGTGTEPEAVVEAPKGPPSLISALNVEKALRGIAITDADHYGRLGIPRGCSYDQVTLAYKNKVEELMTEGLDQEELNKKLDLLKESHSILSSEEERRLYDWSLSRNENPDRYLWPFEVDITQTPTESPPQQEPEDVGPTRLVGYFMFGWIVLALIFSIVLNR